ncbi:MAG: 1,4-dihydroxy-2-naphthoyl-CoA synthase [Actinobacteria bacterium]|nr:1,4-dihydroxy-2-naphthoyl-CoA synthase [Actinomycetota bacterium]
MPQTVSELFDASIWAEVPSFSDISDVTYHKHKSLGIARVAFNRPEVRNAFRPQTVDELIRVLSDVQADTKVGVVLLTGNGPSEKDGVWAFSSGGDQKVRGPNGYEYGEDGKSGRLHILEVQRLIRFMPKVVIALVSGWAAGGGHSLNVVADLSIASKEHARFKQTDAAVGSFDAGYGSAYLAKQVGQKFAREIFFLGEEYSAQRAYEIGVVNKVVDHADLEKEGVAWATEILKKSPQAIRLLKYAMNMVDDGLVGQQLFAGEATRLAYGTDEAIEGRDSFLEKRDPDWSRFPWHF